MREIGEHFPSGSPQSTHSLGRRFAGNSASSRAGGKLRIEKSEESGGEGGIRTHVPELPDHPISSRRRYDHFGTSPLTYHLKVT